MPTEHSADLTLNSSGGGSQRVTIPAATTVAATDQPCRSCCMIASNARVRVNISSAASSSVGMNLPVAGQVPLEVRVDNLSLLNFIGTENDTVDILWWN